MADNNLFPESFNITKTMRAELNGHKAALLWFTGLSGSGKSTIARALDSRLFNNSIRTYILDGDNIRGGLSSDLGFSLDDRHENIRRTGEVGHLFADAGVITMAALISPFRKDRDHIRKLMGPDNFIEIWVKCSLACCEKRDVKRLYRRARGGDIADFTGISSPYQPPLRPEIILDSEKFSIDECVDKIIVFLSNKEIINEPFGTTRE
ncbi:MAG: adenylyl-sulfate kinase [Spirochaetales bacterium]|nr:adenylyl-sulfate kinase [Spirochaetales bacterium]